MKMYVFIINPIAGNYLAGSTWDKIKDVLEKRKIEYRSFFTKYPGHASEIAEQVAELHQDKLEGIVAVGGDGTIYEVLNGLTNYPQLAIGYIPSGTSHDFALNFSIPLSPMKALEQILQRKGRIPRKIDIGRFTFLQRKKDKAKYFFNGIGIGFDADLIRTLNESKYRRLIYKFRFVRLAYFLTALRMLFKTYKGHPLLLKVDGMEKEFEEAWLVSITNAPYYSGGLKIAPKARTNDGKLHVCVIHEQNKWKILLILLTILLGKKGKAKGVSYYQGMTAEVSGPAPITLQADGEMIGMTPIHVRIEPQERKII